MGMRVVWVAFGAATFYIVAAVVVQAIVVVLQSRGVAISDVLSKDVTQLGALLVAALGGTLGFRHAKRIEERHGGGISS